MIYKDEGKSPRWVKVNENLQKFLSLRQETFLEKQRDKFFQADAAKHFHKNVKNFKSADKPKQFNVADLLPDKTEKETAEAAAEFFYKISREFEPLAENDIPSSYDRALPELSVPEVAKQLREQKKPGSMVSGDIFPKLINACSDSLAIPLTDIFNCIVRTGVWPKRWKVEYVTLIPKKTAPTSFAEL